MSPLLINYSVKEEHAHENVQVINALFEQLKASQIQGISHKAYRVGHASFIHICNYSTVQLCDEVTNIAAFKLFLNNLVEIVDQEPIAHDVEELGYYSHEEATHYP